MNSPGGLASQSFRYVIISLVKSSSRSRRKHISSESNRQFIISSAKGAEKGVEQVEVGSAQSLQSSAKFPPHE